MEKKYSLLGSLAGVVALALVVGVFGIQKISSWVQLGFGNSDLLEEITLAKDSGDTPWSIRG